ACASTCRNSSTHRLLTPGHRSKTKGNSQLNTETEHGTFARQGDSRRIRGLLLPYDEPSRLAASGTESIAFSRGAVTLPRDPSVVTLNVEHDRFSPIGRAVALEDTDAGVVAEFEVADTDEGDEYLADMSKRKL